MRMKIRRCVTPIIVVLNFIVFYYVWKPISNSADFSFVIRELESFENDLEATVNSIVSQDPNYKVYIILDDIIYPPVILDNRTENIFIINRAPAFFLSHATREPLLQIKTKYMFIIPDSTILPPKDILSGMVNYLDRKQADFIAIKHQSNTNSECLDITVNPRKWYVEYSPSKYKHICSNVIGKHLLLARTEALQKLSDPFMQPFPEALYLQTAAQKLKVVVHVKHKVMDGKLLFSTKHNQWKLSQLYSKRRQKLYQTMGIKKMTDQNRNVAWFGCHKNTPRCFGTIVDDMPSYLWENKWTPPCCLKALRETALHVFEKLEKSKIRYWLEGGSLLGAYRSSDIIPWDYDVDVGIYSQDLLLNVWLQSAKKKPTIDDKGFLWEKATEGEFFRVHYSHVNHIHVDIFPFYSKNGTMTKSTWFKNHVQDREFPEKFLKPLSSIFFIGRQVSAPNNIREFLEFKFGKNAIDKPAYPNPSRLPFKI